MTDPTIHITKSALIAILTTRGIMCPRDLVEEIFLDSQDFALRNRFTAEVKGSTRARKAKKAEVYAIPEGEVELFNKILTSYRKTLKHVFIPIRREDVQWRLLGEIASDAKAFSELHKFTELQSGYLAYVTKGIELMRGKYGLNRFKSYKDKISDDFNLERTLRDDNNPEATEKFTLTYINLMKEESGVWMDANEFTNAQRIDLLMGRLQAEKQGVKYKEYLRAQFAELSFMGGVAETYHLHGDAAGQRVKSFLAKQGVESKDLGKSGGMKEYYDNLKKHKDGTV
jgi:hypothetical protein